MPEKRPPLGQPVEASAYVYKRTVVENRAYFTRWRRKEQPVKGLYMGYRQVFEGEQVWLGDEEGMGFVQHKNFEVWLVVEHERRNPARVLPADVELLEEQNG